MFIQKEKTILDEVYSFKKGEQYLDGVKAFERVDEQGNKIIYIKNLENVLDEDKTQFLSAIEGQFGNAPTKRAEASFLSAGGIWFDVLKIENKKSAMPFGQFVATDKQGKVLATLSYVSSKALLSGKTQYLPTVSNDDVEDCIYEQLFLTFMEEEVEKTRKLEEKMFGSTELYMAVEHGNKKGEILAKNICNNPRKFNCSKAEYFEQNPEEFSESTYLFVAEKQIENKQESKLETKTEFKI